MLSQAKRNKFKMTKIFQNIIKFWLKLITLIRRFLQTLMINLEVILNIHFLKVNKWVMSKSSTLSRKVEKVVKLLHKISYWIVETYKLYQLVIELYLPLSQRIKDHHNKSKARASLEILRPQEESLAFLILESQSLLSNLLTWRTLTKRL